MTGAGDEFPIVYRDHYARLVGVMRGLGATGDEAEDIVQEAFVRTFARWRGVSTGSNPVGYVYRCALNELRSRARRRRLLGARAGRSTTDPSPEVPTAELLAVLRELERLPRQQRACALLRCQADLDVDEIALVLRLAPSTVRVHIHTARRALTRALGSEDGDGAARAAIGPEHPS